MATRRQLLRELAPKLAELVADLQSVAAPQSDIEPLEKLQTALAQLTASADASAARSALGIRGADAVRLRRHPQAVLEEACREVVTP